MRNYKLSVVCQSKKHVMTVENTLREKNIINGKEYWGRRCRACRSAYMQEYFKQRKRKQDAQDIS